MIPTGFGILAAGAIPFSTWNPSDKSASLTLSGGNLTVSSTSGATAMVRTTTSKTAGKLYTESTLTTVNSSDCRVGVANSTQNLAQLLGESPNGVGYRDTGAVRIGGATVDTIDAYVSGNIICMAVDFSAQRIWFRVNGGNWNDDAAANPATNTGGINYSAVSGGLFVAQSYRSASQACTLNVGASSFTYTVPSGFAAWG